MAQDSDFLAVWDTARQRAALESRGRVMDELRRNWFDTLAATAGGMAQNATQAALQASVGDGTEALRPADVAMVLGAGSHAWEARSRTPRLPRAAASSDGVGRHVDLDRSFSPERFAVGSIS